MKIGSKLQYEVPDKCPAECKWNRGHYSGFCIRCPVFNCGGSVDELLIPPIAFCDSWAAEWEEFFKTGKEPDLQFRIEEIK